jgi:hypothetical protein
VRSSLFKRVFRNRRRRARCAYSSIRIEGKVPYAWFIVVMDQELRERGRYVMYLN